MKIELSPSSYSELNSKKNQCKTGIFFGSDRGDTFDKKSPKTETKKTVNRFLNNFLKKTKAIFNIGQDENITETDKISKLKEAGFTEFDIKILLKLKIKISDAIQLKSAGFDGYLISTVLKYKKLEEVKKMIACGFDIHEILHILKFGININRALAFKQRYKNATGEVIFALIKSKIPPEKTDTLYNSETGLDFDSINFFNLYDRMNTDKSGTYSKTQDLQKKVRIIDTYNSLSDLLKEKVTYLLGKDISKEIKELEKSITHIITPTVVSKEDYSGAFQKFFANNTDVENTIKTADFANFKKAGLPLQISREKFLSNLSELTAELDEKEQTDIFNKLGIEVIKGRGKTITGYNGIIDLTKLSKNGTEGKVLEKASEFILNNKITTQDTKLNESLNALIKAFPEFINIIGKKQHESHSYSVDIHMLEVLKRTMKHSEYEKLSGKDKTCLKIAAIFHDIAKEECENDEGKHANISARYIKDILDKSNTLPHDMKDRIYELVNNHHWLEKYNTGNTKAKITAGSFRHKDDYTISKILADSDIKSINGNENSSLLSALSAKKQSPIQEILDKINSTGQIIFTTKPVFEVPKTSYTDMNSTRYNLRVVNFRKIPNGDDLSKFGFLKGTKKEDVRFLVHMTDVENGIQTVDKLQDISQGGYLCASYISPNNAPTCDNLRFGLSLEAENENIANALNQNQFSGIKKNFIQFVLDLTQNKSPERNFIPSRIKQELDLSDKEYSILYETIASKRFSAQIKDDLMLKVGDKELTGKAIKEAISKANDALFTGNSHNEINVYNPKVNGVVAKVNSLDDVPPELLEFTQTHDLPIYLI